MSTHLSSIKCQIVVKPDSLVIHVEHGSATKIAQLVTDIMAKNQEHEHQHKQKHTNNNKKTETETETDEDTLVSGDDDYDDDNDDEVFGPKRPCPINIGGAYCNKACFKYTPYCKDHGTGLTSGACPVKIGLDRLVFCNCKCKTNSTRCWRHSD